MPNKKEKVLLIDGSGILFRAYYAFISRPLTTSRGESTSAIFGFLKILAQIIRDYRPDRMAIAFDLSRDTFRREMYKEYKAHREETPQDLKDQIPPLLNILEKMGLSVVQMEKYEADDIIGTLAAKLDKKDDVFIMSGDKDLLQLVGGSVRAIRPQKGISEVSLLDREGVLAAMGIYPEQIPDYLAITGDPSDNIPGVKGIGDKGAKTLLSAYKDLEDIYAHVDEVKGAMQAKLKDSKDIAFLSKALATIKRDLDIDEAKTVTQVDPSGFLNKESLDLLEYYQIQSVIQDMKKLADRKSKTTDKSGNEGDADAAVEGKTQSSGEAVSMLKGDYSLVLKTDALDKLIADIQKAGFLSLDTETTTAVTLQAGLIGISVSINEGEGFFVPVLYPAGQDFGAEHVLRTFKPVLEDANIKKIGQNQKFEHQVFRRHGIELCGLDFDTMIAAYLLNPTRTHNNLESLVMEYLGLGKAEYKQVLAEHARTAEPADETPAADLFSRPAAKKKKEATLLDVPAEALRDYACSDSDAALRLCHVLGPQVKSAGLENVFYKIEMPLVTVLSEMEMAGVLIDTKLLSGLSGELAEGIAAQEKKIYRIAGKEFNINSPAQLSKILFDDLGLEPVKKTSGGKASTDEEVLGILAEVNPLPAEILQYRTYSKLKGTYIDALPELVLPETGRVHTSFNQTITATGRLSSSDPNLQNIPVRDEVGKKIRGAFIAPKGSVLISADYSQIELRVLAHFCGDAAMKKAFSDGLDFHRHTAAIIFGTPENSVTDEMRQRAKAVNFGIIYGLQAFGLSRQLGISMGEAKQFIEDYFKSFPLVRDFVTKVLNDVKEKGEVRTLSGRCRKFPDLAGKAVKNIEHLNGSQRMALNTVIQGSAADIIKIAMLKTRGDLAEKTLQSRLILQIHDELVLEAPEGEADAAGAAMKQCMEGAVRLDVPLSVDMGVGKDWGTAH